MAINPGTRLGSYEITGSLGAGGMGEVYRARDAKLGREVAIKTLPASLASDKERLARFEREAKLLASLNHAHIGAIYGLDEQAGALFIAMELIEGQSLEEKLKAGALPVEEALRLGLQIAEALEAAHAKGVVHRDLKPANVMVTADGVVKVLDFGLAKAFAGDPAEATAAHSPALSLAMTQQGLVLGTAGYMSPEQASGQATDQRADVWAFGVVLYEMLTGLPLFGGESVPHILADVLRSQPDWTRLPQNLHPRIRQLLERCLEKRPRYRYAGIADARTDIEVVLKDPAGVVVRPGMEGAGAHGHSASLSRRFVTGAGLVLAGVVVAGAAAWLYRPESEPRPVNRFASDTPYEFSSGTNGSLFAFSPDGRRFVVNTGEGLALRELDELAIRTIQGTQEFLRSPFFSPDGRTVAYRNGEGKLKRIAVSGGAAVIIVDRIEETNGARWGEDGMILFGQSDGIYRVSANGGTPERIVAAADAQELSSHGALPGGDTVLYSRRAIGADWDTAEIIAESLATGEKTVLVHGGSDARYVPSGHLVYVFGDALYAQAFDVETLTVFGGSVPIVQGLNRAGREDSGNYGVSRDGSLAYLSADAVVARRTLVWIDREGREEPIDIPARSYMYAQLSPDGTEVALDSRDEENDVWVFNLARATLQRLTLDPGLNRIPIWHPDGRLTFSRGGVDGAEEVWIQAADGSGMPQQLTTGSDGLMMPNDVSPDGSLLLYMAQQQPRDIWMVPIGDAPATGEILIGGPADQYGGNISPDGRFLAYQSNESGQWEVWVRPFPDVSSGRVQVSRGGGTHPLWSRSGDELFYLDLNGQISGTGALMAVPIDTTSGFEPGVPQMLFENSFVVPQQMWSVYDISPDGQRFLMFNTADVDTETEQRREVVIVENWVEELKRLVPTE
jgi:serine/threonine-protein kinase